MVDIKSNETVIKVPSGIRYMSEWKDFGFHTFPSKCIVDKQIPGCGYTEWALTCPYPVIIASPRKMLLQNKKDQHPEVFLVVNEKDKEVTFDVDLNVKTPKISDLDSQTLSSLSGVEEKDLSVNPSLIIDISEDKDFRKRLYKSISEYLETFSIYDQMPKSNPLKKYPKILVTYDSYYIVKGILEDLNQFQRFYTVIDEMQSILSDARFKSDAELKFMKALESVDKVQFISATPILGKYIQMLDEFNKLPYYRLDWETLDPNRVKKPEFEGIYTLRSVGEKIADIVKKYKQKKFDTKLVTEKDGSRSIIISDEAVFYVNSVRHIISAIKKCELKPEEVNILCSNTPENRKKVKGLGPGFDIGTVPLRGVKPKMFTFCTRTVYLGADFYSTCARSFIFSDSNSDCLSVDISQDLPQIFGRQRLMENPWKNCATLYYRATADYRRMTDKEFEDRIKEKVEASRDLLDVFSNSTSSQQKRLLNLYERNAKLSKYKFDYVSVTGGIPVFNDYACISEVRSFDIQQIDYSDRFTVFSNLEKLSGKQEYVKEISDFLDEYVSIKGKTWKRLKLLCDFNKEYGDEKTEMLLGNLLDIDPVKEVYLAAGPEVCSANKYIISSIKKLLGSTPFDRSKLDYLVHKDFHEGKAYLKSVIKSRLQEIFEESGYGKKAKATSIEEWYETQDILISNPSGKGNRIRGFKLIKRKK